MAWKARGCVLENGINTEMTGVDMMDQMVCFPVYALECDYMIRELKAWSKIPFM